MIKRLIPNCLGALSLTLLLMTVACSHTKRTVSQLDELSPESNSSAQAEKAVESSPMEETVAPVSSSDEALAPEAASVEAPSESAEVAVVSEVPQASEELSSGVESLVAPEQPSEVSVNNEPVLDNTLSEAADTMAKVDDFKAEAPASVPVPEPSQGFLFETEKNPSLDLNTVEKDLASARKRVRKPKKEGAALPKVETTAQMKVEEKPKVVAAVAPPKPSPQPQAVVEEAPKPELASSDLSTVIEKNLLWVALGIVGGIVAAFVTIRSRKKSDPL